MSEREHARARAMKDSYGRKATPAAASTPPSHRAPPSNPTLMRTPDNTSAQFTEFKMRLEEAIRTSRAELLSLLGPLLHNSDDDEQREHVESAVHDTLLKLSRGATRAGM